MLVRKVILGSAVVGVIALLIALTGSSFRLQGQERPGLLLVQQDKVIKFNNLTGEGIHLGTATGRISGVSIVNFKFSPGPAGLPDYIFDNRTGITDFDGHQIIFRNVGGGRFVVPPLIDKTSGLTNQVFGATPLPCPGFGGPCSGVGGPLSGTYEVVATSGKYVNLYPLGQKFPYRGVAYNPSSPPGDPYDMGAVYIEVSAIPLR